MIAKILALPIRAYQKYISPLLPARCLFLPTCSRYALQALQVHGALKGSILAVWRLLRCNPFNHGGYDPVPPKGRWRHPRAFSIQPEKKGK